MTYQVLARKWRPQAFDAVVGQDAVTRTLRNALASGRVAHAYLFTGPRGVGKTTTARLLAKALACTARGESPEACGTCPSCLDFVSGAPVDVLEIDAASNNGVDEIRTLRENVKYSPARGRFKVYVVDEVHMLSGPAFNAFLKTLEEPPPHVVFILATTDPKRIPPTVLSRCQRFDFRPIPHEMLTAQLDRDPDQREGVVRARGAAAPDPGVGGQPARRALAAGRRHRLRRGQAGGVERGRAARLGLAGTRARDAVGPPRGRRRRRARGRGPRRAPG